MSFPDNDHAFNDHTFSNVTDKLISKEVSPLLDKQRMIGIIVVIVLVVDWVGMGEGLQALQNGSQAKYDKPFFQTYVIHSCYSVCIASWVFWYYCIFLKKHPNEFRKHINLRVFLTAFVFALLSYASGLFWYESLPLTSIGVNTAVYQSSCIWIYIFSIIMLKEKVTLGKIFSVIICVAGVAMVTIFGKNNTGVEKNTVVGYVWVLSSTLVYSFAETLYGKLIHTQDVSWNFSFLFLGLMGAVTVLFLWPIVVIVHYTKVEIWEFPSLFDLAYYVLYAVLDTIFNVGFFIGIHLTSPLFMAVGTLLTIPLSVIVDKVWHNIELPWISYFGMIMVVIGFLGLNLSESLGDRIRSLKSVPPHLKRFVEIMVFDIRLLCQTKLPEIPHHRGIES